MIAPRLFFLIGLLLSFTTALRLPPYGLIKRTARLYMSSVQTPPASTAVKFSGSSGAALEISDVCLSIGNNDVMSNVNWTILPKERWALVGRNGAGKSTLLRAITGTGGEMVAIREGEVCIAKKARMGYLEQKGVSGSTRNVREEVASRMDRLTAATKAFEDSEKAVAEGDTSDEALTALSEAAVEFEAAGGYTVEQKIANVLKGLGFVEEDYERKCSEFSGGWQMRIALARLLLSEPDLLLLDEPTNHLDKGARDWLGDYLSRYDGTLLVVSHDTTLLKAAVSSIAEVRGGTVELYKSRTHDQWVIERDERVKAAQAAYEANQREIARLQTFVDRFGAKTMGASLAQSKLKTIEKLEAAAPGAPKTGDDPLPVLRLPNPPRGSQILMELKGCKLGWPAAKGAVVDPDAPAPTVLSDVHMTIERGMRIVVRGPNGAGKSTLLSALSGKLPPMEGSRTLGDGLELGVFTQDLAQDLDQTALAKDVVTSLVRVKDPSISDEKARSVLGALGLIGEKAVRLVGHLSGGEKARVALASFVLIPHNLLLLDEPSNHLDLATLQVLTKALREFEGSVIVISHDRTFLEELEPTHVVTVRGGRVDMQERSLKEEDWNDPIDSREDCTQKYVTAAAPAAPAVPAGGKVSTASAASSSKKSDKKKGGGGKASATTTTVHASKTPITASSASASSSSSSLSSSSNSSNNSSKLSDDEIRKMKLNAPRRITKIENSLEKHSAEMTKIDDDMIKEGRNRGKLQELQKSKEELQVKIDKLNAEYEDLLQYV